jgi:hypothetical protein
MLNKIEARSRDPCNYNVRSNRDKSTSALVTDNDQPIKKNNPIVYHHIYALMRTWKKITPAAAGKGNLDFLLVKQLICRHMLRVESTRPQPTKRSCTSCASKGTKQAAGRGEFPRSQAGEQRCWLERVVHTTSTVITE